MRYGPHEELESFDWAFGGVPYVVTKDGEKKTLKIGDDCIYEGSEIASFVRFGERTMLGATATALKFFSTTDSKSINTLALREVRRIKDQDLFLTALKLGHSYDLWASKGGLLKATTIYEMALHEDEEFGDSTLHWIEGDLDLKSEKMRVLQHQMPIPRVACKDLQPIEELIGNRDQNLGIPDRDEKPLIGTVGIIDEDEDKRFVFTSNDGQSFNFDRGAANTSKVKEWRAERDEWMGETVEIEWKCVYHQPDDQPRQEAPRAHLDEKFTRKRREEEQDKQTKPTRAKQK